MIHRNRHSGVTGQRRFQMGGELRWCRWGTHRGCWLSIFVGKTRDTTGALSRVYTAIRRKLAWIGRSGRSTCQSGYVYTFCRAAGRLAAKWMWRMPEEGEDLPVKYLVCLFISNSNCVPVSRIFWSGASVMAHPNLRGLNKGINFTANVYPSTSVLSALFRLKEAIDGIDFANFRLL